MEDFLLQPLIYLCAAGIMAPLAERTGLGSVLGYLLAGIAIGPVLGLVGSETETLQGFAEIGVVLLLFLVGLELQPRMLWDLRARLFGLGGLQVLATSLALGAFALTLGNDIRVAIAIGLILSLSSTAIVLQTLAERGLMKTEGGRAGVAVLLFQDVFVVAIIALLPLLAGAAPADPAEIAAETETVRIIAALPGWAQGLATLGAVAVFIVVGRFVVRPLLRVVAHTRLRETFTVVALLLVVAIAWLTGKIGLSPALGAFLAGVVLADSEFRHELQSDIEPFKGILLGLFFITVGAGMEFAVLTQAPISVALWVGGLLLVKIAVLWSVARIFGLPPVDRWLLTLGLAQAGEFAFVLFSVAVAQGVLTAATADMLTMAAVLSMLLTPALFMLYLRVVRPAVMKREPDGEPEEIAERGVAIIVGIGRFGQIVHRMLRASGFETVVLDHSMSQVRLLRTFGVPTYYGDATRPDMLAAAGIADAKVLVIALGNPDRAVDLVECVKAAWPHVKIVARANDRLHYYRLRAAGADVAVRELFGSSLEAARCTLEALGVSRGRAVRMEAVFRAHDQATLEELYAEYLSDPETNITANPRYIDRSRAAAQTLGEVLARDGLLDDAAPAQPQKPPADPAGESR